MLDNHAVDQHPRGKDGIVERKRYHPHCAPTCSLWLNQLERWLGLLSQRAVKRGTCRHVTEPVKWIQEFTAQHNESAQPFV